MRYKDAWREAKGAPTQPRCSLDWRPALSAAVEVAMKVAVAVIMVAAACTVAYA